MSTINHNRSSRRAISNVNFISRLLQQNNARSNFQLDQMAELLAGDDMAELDFGYVDQALDQAINRNAGENDVIRPIPFEQIRDAELKEFLLTVCTRNGDNVYRLNPGALRAKIKFQISCTSPWFRQAANNLIGENQAIEESLLYQSFLIGFLNRIWCIIAELYAEHNKRAHIAVEVGGNPPRRPGARFNFADPLFALWFRCQRARSGTFDNPLDIDIDMPEYENWTVQQFMDRFDQAQRDPMSPFNKQNHRRRTGNLANKADNERYLLSLDAGALKTRVESDSTLGMVQRALGLPERCDISGTTTDAMGAGWQLFRSRGGAPFDTGLYALANIVSMALQGHHSLDEMGASVSLSLRNANYNPLNPRQFVDLLRVASQNSNNQQQGLFQDHLHGPEEWLTDAWLALSDFSRQGVNHQNQEEAIASWNFNNTNWRVWKMFANAYQAQLAP